MKKIILILAIALSACAGTAFKWSDARQVKEGMTTAEVAKLIGMPNNVRAQADSVRYVWVWVNSFTGTRTLVVDFKDGRVIKAPPIPDEFKD